MSYRTRNRILAFKIESASGTEETPTVAADAIKAENIQPSPNFETIQTNEHLGGLDASDGIVGGGNFGFRFDALLRGPGSGNAGTAPEIGPLLRAAGMAETLLANDETGTAQAGAASTITLAASGPSSTDDFYNGMVITLDGGTGSGQTRQIVDYVGSSKVATVDQAWDTEPDATSTYKIFACAKYTPASQDIPTGTVYQWDRNQSSSVNALLRKAVGCAAAVTLEIPTRGIGRLSFTLTGQLPALPTNVSDPGEPTFDAGRPLPWIGASTHLGGTAVKINRLSVDPGNDVQMADDQDATYGFDVGQVVGRRITGTVNPQLALLSARNAFSDWLGGTKRTFATRWGDTAGLRVAITMRSLKYTGATPADVNGYINEDIPFEATGADDGWHLCFY